MKTRFVYIEPLEIKDVIISDTRVVDGDDLVLCSKDVPPISISLTFVPTDER